MRPRSRELAILRDQLWTRIRAYDRSTRGDPVELLEEARRFRDVVGALLVLEYGEAGGRSAAPLTADGPWADILERAPGLGADAQRVDALRAQHGDAWPYYVSRPRG